MEHVPVLREDVQKYLSLREGEVVVDGTLGLGGHARDIMEKLGKSGKLFAFDQDERNLAEAKKRLKEFETQITFIHDNFRHLKSRVIGSVDAILLDLGLSSPHVDDPERGFSFQKEGPLDMRFDPRTELTAAEVINTYEEPKLSTIFWRYGEEKMAGRIARKICEQRKLEPFKTTLQLAEFLEANLPKQKRHPATQIFQALRIEVNDELKVLEEVLDQAYEILNPGGRLVVISYHSLEDRIVKQAFKKLAQPKVDSIYSNYGDPLVELLTKKPITPSAEEVSANPRSRSAHLRAYKKI